MPEPAAHAAPAPRPRLLGVLRGPLPGRRRGRRGPRARRRPPRPPLPPPPEQASVAAAPRARIPEPRPSTPPPRRPRGAGPSRGQAGSQAGRAGRAGAALARPARHRSSWHPLPRRPPRPRRRRRAPDPRGALQLLALLQREGRLVDFLEEDLDRLPGRRRSARRRAPFTQGASRPSRSCSGSSRSTASRRARTSTVAAGFDRGRRAAHRQRRREAAVPGQPAPPRLARARGEAAARRPTGSDPAILAPGGGGAVSEATPARSASTSAPPTPRSPTAPLERRAGAGASRSRSRSSSAPGEVEAASRSCRRSSTCRTRPSCPPGAAALPWDRRAPRGEVVGELARSLGAQPRPSGWSRRRRAGSRTRRSTGAPPRSPPARPPEVPQALAARGLGALPRAPARGLGPRAVAPGDPARALAAQEVDAHRAGLVRRGGARADRRGGARRPGSTQVTLLEEPQAALYAWLEAAGRRAGARQVKPGDLVLVVRRRRRHHRLLAHRGGGPQAASSASSASRSAITSCSAATTWTSRSRTRWPTSSRAEAARSTAGSSSRSRTARARRRRRSSPTRRWPSCRWPSRGAARRLVGGALRTELTRVRARRRRLVDGFFPRVDARRAARRRTPHRPHHARPALRLGPGGHPPPGRLPGPAPRGARAGGAPRRSRSRARRFLHPTASSSTAAS